MTSTNHYKGQIVVAICFIFFAAGCASTSHRVSDVFGGGSHDLTGKASWYGPGFNGKLTANGERFKQNGISAAHKTLPFGTIVKVTNLMNGKSVEVRINDRGPFVRGRVIDLSKGAAKKIDMIQAGVVPVQVEIIRMGS